MRNRTAVIATNACFLAGVLMRLMIDNGLQVCVVDNDNDLANKLNTEYPKFIFIENCFHGNGTDIYVHKLAKRNKHLHIVVWTAYELKPRTAVRFIEAGAVSFISLRDTDRNVKQAIEQISYGHHYFPSDVEAAMDDDLDDWAIKNELTNRELEILKLAIHGKTVYQISKLLNISINTIFTHKKKLFKKCGGKSIVEVFCNGLKKGIITEDDIH